MHETTARLFAAIEEMEPGGASTSKIAARMNVADNRVTNWKARGISFEGAIQAEAAYGIPAAWIMYGKMPPQPRQWPFPGVHPEDYARLAEPDREDIQELVRVKVSRLSKSVPAKAA
ncbi:hypothetical protein [Achromobacter insuavis]|uniref:hypothetical protein n=1 Tax=Achromobacter insuavis TaxID=1287735 RepID=UPI001EED4C51|nr:hypothetical protein [Achromobacter insuavis]